MDTTSWQEQISDPSGMGVDHGEGEDAANDRADLAARIAEAVAAVNFGKPSARKGGRNPQWPYLPVVVHDDDSGVRLGADRQETIVRRAFATRDEAVTYAGEVIANRRAALTVQLAEPRMRALRRQHGLPEEIDR